MYVQHPYKFDRKYYAKIDGEYIEISKEVAKVMLADYRNEIYRSRKWAPDTEEQYRKRKVKRTEILDCAFSANAEGVSIQDLADPTQMGVEEMVLRREEAEELHRNIDRLTEQEQFIIRSIYFEGVKQVDVARELGISKSYLSQKLGMILKKMRKMYKSEQ